MSTYVATAQTIKQDWYVIDATDKPLGRLATEVARRLRGKHKPEFTPNADTGDYIIVINAEKIYASGQKLDGKKYFRHTGYIGGIKETSLRDMLKQRPIKVIELAVKGMMPRGPLGRDMLRKLKVYQGSEHQHNAQQPQVLEIEG